MSFYKPELSNTVKTMKKKKKRSPNQSILPAGFKMNENTFARLTHTNTTQLLVVLQAIFVSTALKVMFLLIFLYHLFSHIFHMNI